ncbi:MAG: hypothetical protein EX271_10390 [Acidimicrobiales bacterium]|nr:MAG: hypothetical protein EX271_10390 [Acidimicrobiales bacterium]
MSSNLLGVTIKFFDKFMLDESGATLPLFTIAVPMVIGAMAVSIEAGYWYKSKSDKQLIVDMAAYAGAMELIDSDSDTAKILAELDALHNGYDPDLGTITINNPPLSGSNTNDTAIEVIITQKGNQYFSKIFGANRITYRNRAVAELFRGSDACVLALNETVSGAFTATGSTNVSLDKCAIGVNSGHAEAAEFGGSSSTIAECLSVVGGVYGAENANFACGTPLTNAREIEDPYEDIAAPNLDDYPTCTEEVDTGDDNVSMSGGRYCKNINLKGTALLDSDSTYIFDGIDVKFIGAASNMVGTGVTLVLMNGATLSNVNGGSNITISAPTAGTYQGIAIYSDPVTQTADEDVKINGGSSTSIEGLLYFPTQNLEFSGNTTGANACTVVVANTIQLTGNSGLTTSGCENSFALKPPKINQGAFLVQ